MTDSRNKTYFISDMHLGARYIKDSRAHEARVTAFLDSIKHDARRLMMLGDVLDYWYEYNSVVPRGHVRFLGKLAELADDGVEILWMTGNHDVWLRDYLRDEIGITVVTGWHFVTLDGHRFLLSHGDDIGQQPLGYRVMKWCFLNPVCQALYSSLHPNITHWVATHWSSHNRTSRRDKAKAKAEHNHTQRLLHEQESALEQIAAQHPDLEYVVMGHLHIPGVSRTPSGLTVVRLGHWLYGGSYAVWDGESVRLESLGNGSVTGGI